MSPTVPELLDSRARRFEAYAAAPRALPSDQADGLRRLFGAQRPRFVAVVANGQRVPEDWHRLSSQALVQRALRAHGNPSWRLDADEVSLVFAGLHSGAAGAAAPARSARPGAALHA